MPVTVSDEDFDYIYGTFEKMMSPWSSHEELVALMKNENRIWKKLREIKTAEGANFCVGQAHRVERWGLPRTHLSA